MRERGKRGGRRLHEYVYFNTFYSIEKKLHKFNNPVCLCSVGRRMVELSLPFRFR